MRMGFVVCIHCLQVTLAWVGSVLWLHKLIAESKLCCNYMTAVTLVHHMSQSLTLETESERGRQIISFG